MMAARNSHRRVTRCRREGAVAVEFALVALPFFALILAILEIAIVLTVSSVLERATMDAARLVRTGQATNLNKDQFKAAVCARMIVFAQQCASSIHVDVRPVTTFTTPLVPSPFTGTGANRTLDDNRTSFNAGQARDLMLVRVWYRQPTFTPFVNRAMTRTGKDTLLQTTSAFRNEPYA